MQAASMPSDQVQITEETVQLMRALEQMDPVQKQEFLEQLTPEQHEQLLAYQHQM